MTLERQEFIVKSLERQEFIVKSLRGYAIATLVALLFQFYCMARLISIVEKLQQDMIMIAEPSEDCPHRDMGVI